MDPILKRQFAALKYRDPESILRQLKPIVAGLLQKFETVAQLSAHDRKTALEHHQAAFLAFMIKHMGAPAMNVTVCVQQIADCDCVIRGETADSVIYKPVQLKQLPSHQLNGSIQIQGIIDQLKSKYPTSSDLVVAIWINRDIKLDFGVLRFEDLRVAQLWFFGDASTGEITLDGGPVEALLDGVRLSGSMEHGIPKVTTVQFTPLSQFASNDSPTRPDRGDTVFATMDQDQLIKRVRTYRLTEGLAERLQLGDEIFRAVEPKLRFFVFGSLRHSAAEDVHQETLKAVAAGLGGFAGGTPQESWGWCYRFARNKVNVHLRKQASDRSELMPPEELWRLAALSASTSPISSADRLDLEHAMQLLRQSKPECYDYLWKHFILSLAYAEIAEEQNLTYDNVRMRVGRCLDEAQTLVS